MIVTVKETGEVTELALYDNNGVKPWVRDLIGYTGAFLDGQFEIDEDYNITTSANTLAWWQQYISDYEATQEEIKALAAEMGTTETYVAHRVSHVFSLDYGDHRANAVQALAELREELQRTRRIVILEITSELGAEKPFVVETLEQGFITLFRQMSAYQQLGWSIDQIGADTETNTYTAHGYRMSYGEYQDWTMTLMIEQVIEEEESEVQD